jgi:hypothetical protein
LKLGGKFVNVPYTSGDIDCIVVYDITTSRFAWIPASILGTGKHNIFLRYIPTANNQKAGIMFFSDYEQW